MSNIRMGEKVTLERDAALIAESLDGSEKAFRELVGHYHPVVYSVVQAVLRGRDDVEDVVQEVWIKVFRGLSSFRADARFSTWVYRIARNEAINATRRKQVPTDSVDDVVIRAPENARPDRQFHRRAEHDELGRYIAQLDDEYRIALELRYMGEKSYAEVATAMELPAGTVKSYIHRAKIELKRAMARSDFLEKHGER